MAASNLPPPELFGPLSAPRRTLQPRNAGIVTRTLRAVVVTLATLIVTAAAFTAAGLWTYHADPTGKGAVVYDFAGRIDRLFSETTQHPTGLQQWLARTFGPPPQPPPAPPHREPRHTRPATTAHASPPSALTPAELPIAVTVSNYSYCDGPRVGIGALKIKVTITNRALALGLNIGGSNIYRIELLVDAQPSGWSSPWASTSGTPSVVHRLTTSAIESPWWAIPPNPDRRFEYLAADIGTFATHWPDTSLILNPGQSYGDPANRHGDLVYYLPYNTTTQTTTYRVIGIGVTNSDGLILGYTTSLGAANDPNNF